MHFKKRLKKHPRQISKKLNSGKMNISGEK